MDRLLFPDVHHPAQYALAVHAEVLRPAGLQVGSGYQNHLSIGARAFTNLVSIYGVHISFYSYTHSTRTQTLYCFLGHNITLDRIEGNLLSKRAR